MKKTHAESNLIITAASAFLAFALSSPAATLYTGTGSGSALDIATPGNWNNGLPTSAGNPGTINVNSTVNAATGSFTYTDYHITLTGGTMGQFNSGNDPTFSGGTFTVNGGTYGSSGGRAFRNAAGNTATLTSGTINSGSNGAADMNGSTLNLNGGTYQQFGTNRGMRLTGGATLNVNSGGTYVMDTSGTATGAFGVNHLSGGSNAINLNGGSTTVNFLAFGNNAGTPRLVVTLGGSGAGTFSAVNFNPLSTNEVIGARRINWLSGTLMEMTISGANEWASAEWAANRMFFNGQSSDDLVVGAGSLSWADASNPLVGLGGGYYWDYDSITETLSLAVVPEPSSAALVGLGVLAMVGMRRRRA